jgi:hypothetical protein
MRWTLQMVPLFYVTFSWKTLPMIMVACSSPISGTSAVCISPTCTLKALIRVVMAVWLAVTAKPLQNTLYASHSLSSRSLSAATSLRLPVIFRLFAHHYLLLQSYVKMHHFLRIFYVIMFHRTKHIHQYLGTENASCSAILCIRNLLYLHQIVTGALLVFPMSEWSLLSWLLPSSVRKRARMREGVLFSVIVTPIYSHRVHSLHAVERLSQPSRHDDGQPGDDDGKSYRRSQDSGSDRDIARTRTGFISSSRAARGSESANAPATLQHGRYGIVCQEWFLERKIVQLTKSKNDGVDRAGSSSFLGA